MAWGGGSVGSHPAGPREGEPDPDFRVQPRAHGAHPTVSRHTRCSQTSWGRVGRAGCRFLCFRHGLLHACSCSALGRSMGAAASRGCVLVAPLGVTRAPTSPQPSLTGGRCTHICRGPWLR